LIIGILEADELNDEVIQRYGRYAETFEQLLSAVDPHLAFQTYQVTQQEFPQSIDACDAYVLTGSKHSCYEDIPWINQLKQFVVECHAKKKKLIGICFGHQLIAQALGGSVQKHDKGWGIGMSSSDVKTTPHWLTPKQPQFNLLVSHQDQVTRLPQQASLVASNDFCPIAGYHVNHTILTFQGHPEFNHDYLQYIMTQRREVIGEQAYQQAIESLQQDEDNELVAQWIVNFIRGREQSSDEAGSLS
jgi:GMP synthase-like glutamine amidotransferase